LAVGVPKLWAGVPIRWALGGPKLIADDSTKMLDSPPVNASLCDVIASLASEVAWEDRSSSTALETTDTLEGCTLLAKDRNGGLKSDVAAEAATCSYTERKQLSQDTV